MTNAASRAARPRLVLADDHLLVAQGVERLLLEFFDVVALVFDGDSLLAAIHREAPDLVIADISMPGMTGIDVMRRAQEAGVETPFIFLTMHADSEMASRAICAGGCGYVLKNSAGEELLYAAQQVLEGKTYVTPTLAANAIATSHRRRRSLTDKQQRVLEYVAKGLRSKQIAFELGVSVRTVESHKYAIMQELGVHGTLELVRRAEQEGLLAPHA
ncbi:MAG TPA: response regulator transcription factor [Stenotrophomonas sp.]|nr:response regulator transcription factor [Stenotrophomonas sp.]